MDIPPRQRSYSVIVFNGNKKSQEMNPEAEVNGGVNDVVNDGFGEALDLRCGRRESREDTDVEMNESHYESGCEVSYDNCNQCHLGSYHQDITNESRRPMMANQKEDTSNENFRRQAPRYLDNKDFFLFNDVELKRDIRNGDRREMFVEEAKVSPLPQLIPPATFTVSNCIHSSANCLPDHQDIKPSHSPNGILFISLI